MLSPDSLLSLRDLLRARSALPVVEVSQLLHTLPDILDSADHASGSSLIHDVVVSFSTPPSQGVAELARQPVREWPPFRLLVEEEAHDAGATVVGGLSLLEVPAPARLAALIYELLGGRLRDEELHKGRFSPLAALDEAGNLLLRRALAKRGFADCRSFWREWQQTVQPELAVETEKLAVWQIPERFLGTFQPGEVLELTPLERPAVPTWLVARPIFRIGRSRRLSDLPTRSAQEGQGVDTFKELSRVHVLGERLPNGTLAFRDGNGERPSSNGTAWNEQTLTAIQPTPLHERGMLLLSPNSCRYRLEVLPLQAARLSRVEISNLAEWSGPGGGNPTGLRPGGLSAVTFKHPRGAMVVRQTVWLQSAIGAEILPEGEFRWSDEDYPTQAFVYRYGSFWIANIAAADEIAVNGDVLALKEVAPLATGQVLDLDGVKFQVTVS